MADDYSDPDYSDPGLFLSDAELQTVAKALAAFASFLQEDHQKLLSMETDSFQLPQSVVQAAYNLLQENLEPLSAIQIKLAQHFGMPNMPTG